MRTVLVCALAFGGVATAQTAGNCSEDETASVASCVVDSEPPVIEDIRSAPDALGEALGSDLTPLPEDTGHDGARDRSGGSRLNLGSVLSGDYEELVSPDAHGFDPDADSLFYRIGEDGVRVNRQTREIQEVRPLADDGGLAGDDVSDVGIGASDPGLGDPLGQ